jgi:hypothetical protein
MSHSIVFRGPLAFLCAFWLLLWSCIAMASSPPLTQVRTFHLDAPRARVFSLFTAEGERAWARGWDPRILSGAEERGSVFSTRSHDDRPVTWVVTDYRPAEGRVSYARLVQDSNIGLVDVLCTEQPGSGTEVSVRYTLTALSEAGQAFVTEFLEAGHYAQMIEEWRLATSKALQASGEPR